MADSDLNRNSNAMPVYLVSPSSRAPYTSGVQTLPASGAYTDRSGAITTASTAQQVAPAKATRVGMTFQNTSDTAMRLTENGQAATATTGYLVNPGVAVNISTADAVSVFCTVATKTFSATEY